MVHSCSRQYHGRNASGVSTPSELSVHSLLLCLGGAGGVYVSHQVVIDIHESKDGCGYGVGYQNVLHLLNAVFPCVYSNAQECMCITRMGTYQMYLCSLWQGR